MLYVKVDDKENINRVLKVLKKRFEKTQILNILRDKKQFTKKSVVRRQQIIKAKMKGAVAKENE